MVMSATNDVGTIMNSRVFTCSGNIIYPLEHTLSNVFIFYSSHFLLSIFTDSKLALIIVGVVVGVVLVSLIIIAMVVLTLVLYSKCHKPSETEDRNGNKPSETEDRIDKTGIQSFSLETSVSA